jgi:hypothetical protein
MTIMQVMPTLLKKIGIAISAANYFFFLPRAAGSGFSAAGSKPT